VRRWPTERPLLYLNALAAGGLWVMFLSSPHLFGYLAVMLGVMLLLNLAFVAQLRGSAVRLGPEQFLELHARVEELARQMELKRIPAVYLMQQDGALNAFATRFMRTHFVVLLSDLLEACGDNRAARDMIIGHELGHIRAGHLQLRWLLLPVSFVPFLSSALSRAREHTCDRYGMAAAGDRDGALLGLTILAAGGKYAPAVDRKVFARQRADMRSSWMFFGEWLGSHPPLAKRLIALAPELGTATTQSSGTLLRVLRPAFAGVMVVLVGVIVLSTWRPAFRAAARAPELPSSPLTARDRVRRDFERLQILIESDLQTRGTLPWDEWDLYRRWSEAYNGEEGPLDPYNDEYWYKYDRDGTSYRLMSAGPDHATFTEDDIVFDSRLTPRK
jgi:Zn-dependent protease with chaperone function